MPTEFLNDEQAEAYGTFTMVPTRAELEQRFFLLDDDDRGLIALRRTDAHRLGTAVPPPHPAGDGVRLSTFRRYRFNIVGNGPGSGLCPLRDPDAAEDADDEE